MNRTLASLALTGALTLALYAHQAHAEVALPQITPAQITPAQITPALINKVTAWRRDFHQHPDLGSSETRTAGIIAAHLRALGMEVKTGIAHTGVTGLLKGAKPGRRIAVRADMDALPVTEQSNLPFASKQTGVYRGQAVGVMHACGHDAHSAILMGTAELFAAQRAQLAGEILFIFQPAEEGPPESGQPFGAALMLDEGLFDEFKPEAVFGLHVWSTLPAGKLGYRSGPTMAAADEWTLRIHGKQAHGSRPWTGIDPITIGAQIQLASQSIIARQIDITQSPVVLTTGSFQGGVRYNILPDRVDMTGTIRSFDPEIRQQVIERFERMSRNIAEAHGSTVEFKVNLTAPLTSNDATLSKRGGASLRKAVGADQVVAMPLLTVAEDFSQYARFAPTFFFFVGSTGPELDPRTAPGNHSPQFLLDENALEVGLRAMTQVLSDALAR